MIAWTERARTRLEEYLGQVRASARAGADADPEEMVGDIREHIEAELEHDAPPIDRGRLDEVLERLGEPVGWTEPRTEPADKLDLTISAAALALVFAGLAWEPLLLPAGYLAARYRVTRRALSSGEVWLVYPSLLAVDASVSLAVLLLPYGLAIMVGAPGGLLDTWPELARGLPAAGSMAYWTQILGIATILLGAWWGLIGLVVGRWPRLVRLLWDPFAVRWRRQHGYRLSVVGAVIACAFALIVIL
jgi:hypothetical protein